MGKTKVLNLDELELDESLFTIIHEGQSHHMAQPTVDMFIAQEKRSQQRARELEEVEGLDAETPDENSMARVVAIMKEGIEEFFPTLPVGDLPTQKLFAIFNFLNDVGDKVNSLGAEVDAGDAEGNAPSSEDPAVN